MCLTQLQRLCFGTATVSDTAVSDTGLGVVFIFKSVLIL